MDPLHLGQASSLPASPQDARLDYVPNPRAGALYLVRFAACLFTSLCQSPAIPIRSLVIDYAARDTIVESKAWKLPAASAAIADFMRCHRCSAAADAGMHPNGCVSAILVPPGGMPIASSGNGAPRILWLPDQASQAIAAGIASAQRLGRRGFRSFAILSLVRPASQYSQANRTDEHHQASPPTGRIWTRARANIVGRPNGLRRGPPNRFRHDESVAMIRQTLVNWYRASAMPFIVEVAVVRRRGAGVRTSARK